MTPDELHPALPRYTVGAARQTARILYHLGAGGKPLKLVRITSDLGLNKSTCLNILRTLVDQKLVAHDPETKTYFLGRGLIDLARASLMGLDQRNSIQPLLDAFSHSHRISLIFWRRMDEDLVVVAHSAVGAPVHIRALIGTRVPLLSGSMGRIVACSSDLDRTSLRDLHAAAGRDPGSFALFMEEVDAALKRGWAVEEGDSEGMRRGISAGMFDSGVVRHVASVPLFTSQFDGDQISSLGCDLKRLCEEMSEAMFGTRLSDRRGP